MDKDLHDVLRIYSFMPPLTIEQIDNKSAWQVNNKYILKKNDEEEKDIEKALIINKLLKEEGIPVVEYIKTVSGDNYVVFNGDIYSLMRKMNGEHIKYTNPFNGDYLSLGHHIGVEISRLHKALKKLGNSAVYESDFPGELKTQLIDIKTKNIDLPPEIPNLCLEFASDYCSLPKQLIHRDIQFGNLLFENGRLTCFLDFDSSQVNARIFDIVYFGQSILFLNDYSDSTFMKRWVEFFSSLLYGYHSENMLSKDEINSIHGLFLALQIGFISYYSYLDEKRELIPNRIDMAKWIYLNKPLFSFSIPLI